MHRDDNAAWGVGGIKVNCTRGGGGTSKDNVALGGGGKGSRH